ncbi:unnamed protein product [Candidula unifasciata]|uniref:Uncharacterized protein n=1 Tax=Candidula unifasciata TaxID=100452 RepID=A0A8S3ZFU7_9EUPU|nr:unnamed protein product [Candidula unifasciata]
MSKRAVPEMAFDVSSSDDDAPEEVSVTSSRQQGISQLKDLRESLRKGKEEERERRRQRNEMFKIQKEKKLKDLSKRKLPDDVLEAISAKSAMKTHKKEVPSKKAVSRSDGDDEGGHSEEEDKNSDAGDNDLSDSGVEGSVKGYSGVEDFIPLGSGSGLALVTPGAIAKVAQTAAQKALSFKQNRLYNQRIPRENAQQRRAKMIKRKVANPMK